MRRRKDSKFYEFMKYFGASINSRVKRQKVRRIYRWTHFINNSLQILAAGAPILATVAAGFTTGYSAIFLPQLQSTTSSIQLSNDEASWIASLAAFGKLIHSRRLSLLIRPWSRQEWHRAAFSEDLSCRNMAENLRTSSSAFRRFSAG